jgi:hypothetical protein
MKKPTKQKCEVAVMIRITPDMKAMLEELASAEDRSVSSQVVHMLKTGRAAK